jgi:hypothetical protein
MCKFPKYYYEKHIPLLSRLCHLAIYTFSLCNSNKEKGFPTKWDLNARTGVRVYSSLARRSVAPSPHPPAAALPLQHPLRRYKLGITLIRRSFRPGVKIVSPITKPGYPAGTLSTSGGKPCDSLRKTTPNHARLTIHGHHSAPQFRFCSALVAPGTALPSEVWP